VQGRIEAAAQVIGPKSYIEWVGHVGGWLMSNRGDTNKPYRQRLCRDAFFDSAMSQAARAKRRRPRGGKSQKFAISENYAKIAES
jgi:hypothetical protein